MSSSPVEDMLAGMEPAAYAEVHGGKIVLTSVEVTGWCTEPLYTRDQLVAILTAEREARVKAEDELYSFQVKFDEAFDIALKQARAKTAAAEARLKEAEKVIAPFAEESGEFAPTWPDGYRAKPTKFNLGDLRAAAEWMKGMQDGN
jgi:hypothetical protein